MITKVNGQKNFYNNSRWQDAFIIGSLSGKEEKEDTTEVTVLSAHVPVI